MHPKDDILHEHHPEIPALSGIILIRLLFLFSIFNWKIRHPHAHDRTDGSLFLNFPFWITWWVFIFYIFMICHFD